MAGTRIQYLQTIVREELSLMRQDFQQVLRKAIAVLVLFGLLSCISGLLH